MNMYTHTTEEVAAEAMALILSWRQEAESKGEEVGKEKGKKRGRETDADNGSREKSEKRK